MSILEVEGLSMSFDDKQLYKDASFRLNKEDHMGIIGQNGAGKSTLIKILTGSKLPDEGRIKWQRGVRIGYLDQYAESAHDLTIGAFLQSAFKELFEVQERQTILCLKRPDAVRKFLKQTTFTGFRRKSIRS